MSNAQDDFIPELPPHMSSLQQMSASEILSDLQNSPLFMTEVVQNDDLEALCALAYEGTPFEVASGFKERGNECFKEKGWKDAKEFYGKAIEVILNEVRKRQRGENCEASTEREKKLEVQVLEACLVNRAACHLELQNYRSCCQDCGNALRINQRNIKAYYRSSKALLALDRVKESDDFCSQGLAIDPDNSALRSLMTAIEKRAVVIRKKKDEESDHQRRENLIRTTLSEALQARHITLRKTTQPPEMEDARIALEPDPLDLDSTLCFPTLLLYPLHLQTDFIKAFNETHSLNEHLTYIFPLPWDSEGIYSKETVDCYIETVAGGLLKVGKKMPLSKVLASKNVEVIDQLVKIFVLPKAEAAAWIIEFKQKKAREKGDNYSDKLEMQDHDTSQ